MNGGIAHGVLVLRWLVMPFDSQNVLELLNKLVRKKLEYLYFICHICNRVFSLSRNKKSLTERSQENVIL